MTPGNISRFKSWFVSGGIIIVVTAWLLSGQFSGDQETEQASDDAVTTTISRNAVRVRTQSAEEVMRTIIVNGKTAPARVANLAAETDGRIEYVGAERGASLETGDLIVRLDERDRSARLAQAEATVRQREVEYAARERLKSESYVSEAQLQEAIALLETARAELTRARLDLGYRFMVRYKLAVLKSVTSLSGATLSQPTSTIAPLS
jgi:multidrug efflux system membrane fusion protein